METIINFLTAISLCQWLIAFVILPFVGFFIYFWKYLKAQFRFGLNLKRRIYFLKTSEIKKLNAEKDTLSQLGLFNLDAIKDISEDLVAIQSFPVKTNAVYVVGYDERYGLFKELFESAKFYNNPIIILAGPGEIKKDEHWKIFKEYIYCDVVNSTNRVGIILLV